jgi:hypothetical protein
MGEVTFVPDTNNGNTTNSSVVFTPDKKTDKLDLGGMFTIPQWIEEVGQNWEGRDEEVAQTLEDYQEGEIGAGTFLMQRFGKGVSGKAWDLLGGMVGAGIETFGKGIELLVPDSIEEPIKREMVEAWDWAINTEGGLKAQEALASGIDGWTVYKEDNPQNAKTIESIVNTVLLFMPTKFKKKAEPVKPVKTAFTNFERTAKVNVKEKSIKKLEELILPAATKESVERTTLTGPWKTATLATTKREQAILNEVRKIDGIKPNKSAYHNSRILVDATNKMGDDLVRVLEKNPVIISSQSINSKIDYALAQMLDPKKGNVFLKSDKQIVAALEQMAIRAKEIFSQFPNTPAGILAARKEFDNMIRRELGDAAFDAKNVTIMNSAMKLVRNAANDAVNTAVPKAVVSSTLKRQSRLFAARDVVSVKAIKESKYAIGRLFQNLSRVIGINMNIRRALAVIAGTSVFGVGGYLMAGAAGAIGFIGAGHYAVKGVLSPKTRVAFATLLKETNRAIKVSTNPKMIHQLRADKAILIDILSSPTDNSPHQGE